MTLTGTSSKGQLFAFFAAGVAVGVLAYKFLPQIVAYFKKEKALK